MTFEQALEHTRNGHIAWTSKATARDDKQDWVEVFVLEWIEDDCGEKPYPWVFVNGGHWDDLSCGSEDAVDPTIEWAESEGLDWDVWRTTSITKDSTHLVLSLAPKQAQQLLAFAQPSPITTI